MCLPDSLITMLSCRKVSRTFWVGELPRKGVFEWPEIWAVFSAITRSGTFSKLPSCTASFSVNLVAIFVNHASTANNCSVLNSVTRSKISLSRCRNTSKAIKFSFFSSRYTPDHDRTYPGTHFSCSSWLLRVLQCCLAEFLVGLNIFNCCSMLFIVF